MSQSLQQGLLPKRAGVAAIFGPRYMGHEKISIAMAGVKKLSDDKSMAM